MYSVPPAKLAAVQELLTVSFERFMELLEEAVQAGAKSWLFSQLTADRAPLLVRAELELYRAAALARFEQAQEALFAAVPTRAQVVEQLLFEQLIEVPSPALRLKLELVQAILNP